MKTEILVQTYETAPDMRITGSNIWTGKKAHFHVDGKNKGYKIYMTNNLKSATFYIKLKGINHNLINDNMYHTSSVYRLDNLVGWYFEKKGYVTLK